jgi:hypothetical protein
MRKWFSTPATTSHLAVAAIALDLWGVVWARRAFDEHTGASVVSFVACLLCALVVTYEILNPPLREKANG